MLLSFTFIVRVITGQTETGNFPDDGIIFNYEFMNHK